MIPLTENSFWGVAAPIMLVVFATRTCALQRSKQLKTDQEKLQTQRQRPSTKKRSQKLSGLASLSERNGAEQSAWNELQNDEAVKIRIFKERTKHSD